MFERYSESARRCIFFARYEAGLARANYIAIPHVLAGIQRARPSWFPGSGAKAVTAELSTWPVLPWWRRFRRSSFSVEIPLDGAAKRCLDLAGEAAKELHSSTIGVAHLLLGVVRADEAVRKKLESDGLSEARIEQLCREDRERAPNYMPRYVSGIGYDLHRLTEGRKLTIGGIEVPFEKGPVGHSDGDVLAHAICDALLGAAGAGDIGTHFPDTDPRWKGVSSLLFLEHARKLLDERRLAIEHVDAVVIAERPKLGPHFPAMREMLSRALGVPAEKIHLKAKTNEGVDAIGRGEAIAAHAVATLAGP